MNRYMYRYKLLLLSNLLNECIEERSSGQDLVDVEEGLNLSDNSLQLLPGQFYCLLQCLRVGSSE